MKRFFIPVLPLILFSCGSGSGGGIPPIGIGGNGIQIHDGEAGTPMETYLAAHGRMYQHHRFLRQALASSPIVRSTVASTLEQILNGLQVMQACVDQPSRGLFDPILKEYSEWSAAASRGQTSGLIGASERLERRIQTELHPNRVGILARFPSAPGVSPTPLPTPPANVPSLWVTLAAWKSAHGDLVEAWSKDPKGDGAAACQRIQEALRLMKPALDPSQQSKVLVYADYYERLSTDTKAFSETPAGSSKEKVLSELEIVAGLIGSLAPPKE